MTQIRPVGIVVILKKILIVGKYLFPKNLGVL